ncbi:MAG: pilW [Rhodocyclaceae bacterium]|nr:pilW [Rhodocyclaceae bacterium]
MVAMAIGMFGIIIMMQLFALAEDRKRTATGAGDAMSNGAIALYGLQRDIRQGGYGFSALNLFACNVTLPSAATVPLAPLIINPATSVIPAGDFNSDTLLVSFGTANGQPQGNPISGQTGKDYVVQMPSAFAVNDRVIAATTTCPGNLVLDRVSAVGGTAVTVVSGPGGSTLYNLGPAPKVLAYAIRVGNLTVCDYLVKNCGDATKTSDPTVWVPVANNIVRMKAQYGLDSSPMTGAVASWNAAAPTTPSAACGFARAQAARLALVARNSYYDKSTVTTASPSWAGSASNAIDLTKKANGVTIDPDWQHYRYNVFETVVPIRNVTWMGVQAGC